MPGILPGSPAESASAARTATLNGSNLRTATSNFTQSVKNIFAPAKPVPVGPSQQDLLRQANIDPNNLHAGQGVQLDQNSTMILSARGTFYLVKLADKYGPGVYSIDELNQFTYLENARLQTASRSPILITGIEFNQVDITSQVPCLDNIKVFYTFGQNFGQVVITGEILLGPLGDISFDGVERLTTFFWKNRVSVKKAPIAISVAEQSYFVYLTGMRIATINPEFHILPFVLFGTLLDLSKEKANEINTSGTVITGANVDDPSLFAALMAEKIGDPIIGNIEESGAQNAKKENVNGSSNAGTAQSTAQKVEERAKQLGTTKHGNTDTLKRYKAVLQNDRAVLGPVMPTSNIGAAMTAGGAPNLVALDNAKRADLDTQIAEIDKAIAYSEKQDQRQAELEAAIADNKDPKKTAVYQNRLKDVDQITINKDKTGQDAFKKYRDQANSQENVGNLNKVEVKEGQYNYPTVTKDPVKNDAVGNSIYNDFGEWIYNGFSFPNP